MRLTTPNSLLYPITVTKLLCKAGEQIESASPLFNYEYKSVVIEGSEDNKEGVEVERRWPSTFENYIEGPATFTRWFIQEGQVIPRPGVAIAEIEEPCKHEVQFGGMCAECGKDMTLKTYNTVATDLARATVKGAHSRTDFFVSRAEASRSDEEAKRRLLGSRKLSLVVDLDQTVIHATVDPTVAEWQNDPNNPNHHAVKDVRAFYLPNEGPNARGSTCYYIKLRPGLQEFLATISKKFELHIYTMGTRAYARNVADLVDPDRKLFADRILSRDENGSLTVKDLSRIFPVDTKMVIILDDRGDVWHWSQNLIKVTPFDFFVGIGDINSSFLPKRPELEARPTKVVAPTPLPASDAASAAHTAPAPAVDADQATGTAPADASASNDQSEEKATSLEAQPSGAQAEPKPSPDVSAIAQLMTMGSSSDPHKLQEQTTQQDEAIAAQLADRPLLQKQKILDAAEGDNNTAAETDADGAATANSDGSESQPKYRHNLLQDDDNELVYLQQNLQAVHDAFFEDFETRLARQGGRVAELRPGATKKRHFDDLEHVPDVTMIMAAMKQKVLRGVHLVFSGVVPLGVDPQCHDLAIWAKSFGATVSENITKRTTHVIGSPQRRTAKVRQAAKKPDRIKIVTQDWLYSCLVQWKRVSEDHFRIHTEVTAENNEKPTTLSGSPFDEPDESIPLSSSDDEAAFTEDETDSPNGVDPSADNGNDSQEQAELAQYMPSISREDSSPNEETNEDWEGMNDELADFLGSEAEEDSESEAESTRSTHSTGTETTPDSARKRKRDAERNGDSLTDGEESDTSQDGSRLQRRKKAALARSTSLTKVALPEHPIQKQMPQVPEAEIDDYDDDDDDSTLAAELEAEMLRQAEEEDGDE